MNILKLLKKLEGIHTIESIKDEMGVNRAMAVYYVHRLKKEGYVKTKRLSNNRRVYSISMQNKLGGTDYYEIINQNSPIKLSAAETNRIYGRNVTSEETLVYALKTKDFRTILASLALFRKIADWTELYRIAKLNQAERKIGALYDMAKQIMKVRKMPKRFRRNALHWKNNKYEFIIPGLKSKDFEKIQKEWGIYLPFNEKDLEEYK